MAKTIYLQVDDINLTLPEELNSRLESLARCTSMCVTDYTREIITDKRNRIPEWSCFPADAVALLSIYKFCFLEGEMTIKALRSLRAFSAGE